MRLIFRDFFSNPCTRIGPWKSDSEEVSKSTTMNCPLENISFSLANWRNARRFALRGQRLLLWILFRDEGLQDSTIQKYNLAQRPSKNKITISLKLCILKGIFMKWSSCYMSPVCSARKHNCAVSNSILRQTEKTHLHDTSKRKVLILQHEGLSLEFTIECETAEISLLSPRTWGYDPIKQPETCLTWEHLWLSLCLNPEHVKYLKCQFSTLNIKK